MKKATLLYLLSGLFFICIPASAEYQLVWSDEFDCENLNPSVWQYEIGTGYQGWGNWEAEYYTSSKNNVFLKDGNLVIRAIKDETQYDPNYATHFTSGRIITKNRLQAKYGKVEARIKLPIAKKGVWPAFWMLGTSNGGTWPNCGETDIMEYMCTSDNYKNISSYIHWHDGKSQADYGRSLSISNPQEFHIYSVEWTPDNMVFRVDDATIVEADINSVTAPTLTAFHSEFFIILNLAIGGSYVQHTYDPTITEESMYVDYVRVYQDKGAYPSSSLTDNTTECQRDVDYCDMVKSWGAGKIYFAPNWSQSSNYTFSASDRSASIYMGNATYEQWQAQFWCYPNAMVTTEAGANYEVSLKIKSTKDIPNATLKMVQNGNDEVFLFLQRVNLTANKVYDFSFSGKAPDGLTDALFVFDFGGNPANTNVTISDVKVKKIGCEASAIESVENETVYLWPNPTSGVINITAPSVISKIMVRSMVSGLIFNDEVNDTNVTIDLSGQSDGLYFIDIETESGTISQKVIKM